MKKVDILPYLMITVSKIVSKADLQFVRDHSLAAIPLMRFNFDISLDLKYETKAV